MTIRGPAPDIPLPDPVPENVPAVLVPLEPAPAEPPPFGSWTTLLGERGATSFAAHRRRNKGFILIGQHALDIIDLDRLDAEMDREDGRRGDPFREVVARTPGGVERRPCRTTEFCIGADDRLVFRSDTEDDTWHAGGLDGDVVARRVVRQRWVE